MSHEINIREQNFVLHPTGSVFWKEESILLISDVHLGKVTHFRKHGAAVPIAAANGNYELLNRTVGEFNPGRICFLGDLFHSYINKEWEMFSSWTRSQTANILLITGNHDIISPLRYESLNIQQGPELRIGQFLLTHHPCEEPGCYNFSGHIHPAVKLRGQGRQALRLPCFFLTENQAILPAFGEFTGTHVLKPGKRDKVFAIAKNEVIPVLN